MLGRAKIAEGLYTSLPARVGSEAPVNYWLKAAEVIEEAALDARHNPETARSLFRLALYGRNEPAFFCNCEQVSGKPEDRPGLASCLNALHEGDTLAVWKLDRLVRDLRCVIGSTRDMT